MNTNIKGDEFYKFIETATAKELVQVLNKLGKLDKDFDANNLLSLTEHKMPEVRRLAVKNLAKIGNKALLPKFIEILDSKACDSGMQKEAASAIGRMRDPENKPLLTSYLSHKNPEVVLQIIRGLFVFRKDQDVIEEIKKLATHPNEIIRDTIQAEFATLEKTKEHAVSPEILHNLVIHDDVMNAFKGIEDESIHLTFTSPPYYNARDYSIYMSYEEYLNFLKDVFQETHRITKEGRILAVNTSPIIIPRVGRKYSSKRYAIPYDLHPFLVQMGWEFLEDIIWVKPEASAKNRVSGFEQHRKPLTYKPNACAENIMVYRKKSYRLIDWNLRQYDDNIVENSLVKGDYESSNVWRIDPSYDKTHSAVFPVELCNRVVKFYSYVGDLVFDPFAGSGTLGISAAKLNRRFLLVEKAAKYFERIKENFANSNIDFKTRGQDQ